MRALVSPMSMLTPIRVATPAFPIEMMKTVPKYDKQVIMTTFIIAGIKMTQLETTVPLIHWRLAFGYHRGGRDSSPMDYRSAAFDTLKDNTTQEFFVQVKGINGITSTKTEVYWTVAVPNPRYTLQELFNLVNDQNYFNQFIFNGGGSGCRTWTIALTYFFERMQILSPTTAQWAINHIAEYQRANAQSVYIPHEIGATFYRFVQHRDGSWGTYEDKRYIPAGFIS